MPAISFLFPSSPRCFSSHPFNATTAANDKGDNDDERPNQVNPLAEGGCRQHGTKPEEQGSGLRLGALHAAEDEHH